MRHWYWGHWYCDTGTGILVLGHWYWGHQHRETGTGHTGTVVVGTLALRIPVLWTPAHGDGAPVPGTAAGGAGTRLAWARPAPLPPRSRPVSPPYRLSAGLAAGARRHVGPVGGTTCRGGAGRGRASQCPPRGRGHAGGGSGPGRRLCGQRCPRSAGPPGPPPGAPILRGRVAVRPPRRGPPAAARLPSALGGSLSRRLPARRSVQVSGGWGAARISAVAGLALPRCPRGSRALPLSFPPL